MSMANETHTSHTSHIPLQDTDTVVFITGHVQKRNGTLVDFDQSRIEEAIHKAFQETQENNAHTSKESAKKLTKAVIEILSQESRVVPEGAAYLPTVEHIQDLVEEVLMGNDFPLTARAYIIYRQRRLQERKRDIFKARKNLKPYEYPQLLEYVDAVRHSYWVHTEFNFTGDIQDYRVHTTEIEKEALKRTMLAIAQIEVAVKNFWGDIYKKMPKPEIGSVGMTFAESEVRHQDAYAHLLEILGLNEEFSKIDRIPVLNNRVEYLGKALKHAKSDDNKEYAQTVALFSLFIEHVSLFSQFLIIMSFNKHKNLFKGMSNAVEATSKEEQIHGLFGIDVINIIRSERPEWFDQAYEDTMYHACREAMAAEEGVINWIFEKGEFDFMKKDEIIAFIKNRFNNSLKSIGLESLFQVDDVLLEKTEWFDAEMIGTKHVDFFDKRSINYNKRAKSVTSDDLF